MDEWKVLTNWGRGYKRPASKLKNPQKLYNQGSLGLQHYNKSLLADPGMSNQDENLKALAWCSEYFTTHIAILYDNSLNAPSGSCIIKAVSNVHQEFDLYVKRIVKTYFSYCKQKKKIGIKFIQ